MRSCQPPDANAVPHAHADRDSHRNGGAYRNAHVGAYGYSDGNGNAGSVYGDSDRDNRAASRDSSSRHANRYAEGCSRYGSLADRQSHAKPHSHAGVWW